MKKLMIALMAAGTVALSAIADATANVTNLIGRLDSLTANVLSNFVMLTDIPRPTYHEKKVSDALFAWAKERGFSSYQDEMNNVSFDVPATPGMETKPKVILQGHMDMVAARRTRPFPWWRRTASRPCWTKRHATTCWPI